MNGQSVECLRRCNCKICFDAITLELDCVISELIPEFDLILGMDAIRSLGGFTLLKDGRPIFPNISSSSKGSTTFSTVCAGKCENAQNLHIEDQDFSAEFDGHRWIVSWKWSHSAPRLCNRVAQYSIPPHIAEKYHDEVDEWIRAGWLVPFDGMCDGIVPLMAVLQSTKDKVRPVLDYREVNQFVSSHTAASDVCNEKLRSWRRLGSNVSSVDFRKAYLQVHVHPDLWRFQVVEYAGRKFCLTRLGFGLNVAPKIMCAIIKTVLSIDPVMKEGTDSFIDDINENVISSSDVIRHLKSFGLESKPAIPLGEARVLGLRL